MGTGSENFEVLFSAGSRIAGDTTAFSTAAALPFSVGLRVADSPDAPELLPSSPREAVDPVPVGFLMLSFPFIDAITFSWRLTILFVAFFFSSENSNLVSVRLIGPFVLVDPTKNRVQFSFLISANIYIN